MAAEEVAHLMERVGLSLLGRVTEARRLLGRARTGLKSGRMNDLQATGIQARYASGYVHADSDTTTGMTAAGQSDAGARRDSGNGCRSTCAGGPWPALRRRGPLKGIYSGWPAQSLSVLVELTRLGRSSPRSRGVGSPLPPSR
jgi:hypothetical protein